LKKIKNIWFIFINQVLNTTKLKNVNKYFEI
jgi:hypothetical protein